MRTVVTGGAGFIGSAIARELLRLGHEVVVLDNLMDGDLSRVPSEARFVEADLRDPSAVRAAVSGAEVVFHQAARGSVPRSVQDPMLTTECNVMGTLNTLIAAQESGVRRVVYASSSSLYGGVGDGPQREDAVPAPQSPYAASKLAAEYYCKVWTRVHGLSTVSLRYFNVFGPGQNPESQYAAVFPAFTAALLRNEAPVVHWDGGQTRDFTFVDDVVAANLLAAEAGPAADGAVVNIGGGHPRTINEVLEAISREVGTWIEPQRTPKREGDVRTSRADITRAKEILGWEPATPWETAIARTVDDLRS